MMYDTPIFKRLFTISLKTKINNVTYVNRDGHIISDIKLLNRSSRKLLIITDKNILQLLKDLIPMNKMIRISATNSSMISKLKKSELEYTVTDKGIIFSSECPWLDSSGQIKEEKIQFILPFMDDEITNNELYTILNNIHQESNNLNVDLDKIKSYSSSEYIDLPIGKSLIRIVKGSLNGLIKESNISCYFNKDIQSGNFLLKLINKKYISFNIFHYIGDFDL